MERKEPRVGVARQDASCGLSSREALRLALPRARQPVEHFGRTPARAFPSGKRLSAPVDRGGRGRERVFALASVRGRFDARDDKARKVARKKAALFDRTRVGDGRLEKGFRIEKVDHRNGPGAGRNAQPPPESNGANTGFMLDCRNRFRFGGFLRTVGRFGRFGGFGIGSRRSRLGPKGEKPRSGKSRQGLEGRCARDARRRGRARKSIHDAVLVKRI